MDLYQTQADNCEGIYRDAVFRVSLQSQHTEEQYLLTLPAPFERMAQVRESLGVGHISDVQITSVECMIPYLERTYEYGRSVLRRHGVDEELLQAMEGYMDFEKLGEDAMIEDGVRQTEFGLVRRLSEPFPGPQQEQQFGGI